MNYYQGFRLTAFFVGTLLISPLATHAAQDTVDWPKVAKYDHDFYSIVDDIPSHYQFIKALKNAYLKTFTMQDSVETRDAAFLVFKENYDRIVEENLSAENTPLLENWLNLCKSITEANHKANEKAMKKLEKEALTWGFAIEDYSDHDECGVGAKAYMPYLAQHFGSLLSPSWQDYFALPTKANNQNRTLSDEEYFAEVDNERKRLLAYENYVKKHPAALMTRNLRKAVGKTLYYYTNIGDETYGAASYLDDKGGEDRYKLRDAYKASYEKFIQENSDSLLYPAIKNMYDTLKKKNFIFIYEDNKAIDAALEKNTLAAGFIYQGR